jgi:hypothetical protein
MSGPITRKSALAGRRSGKLNSLKANGAENPAPFLMAHPQ